MGAAFPRVREATIADLEAIVAIYLSNARHHAALAPDAYRVPTTEAVHDRFSRMLADPDDEDVHLVAEVQGLVVGALDAFRRPDGAPGSMRIPSRTAEFGIGVLPEWRGRGVGTALIAASEEWARREGLDALVLEVAEENAAAERLYARIGYRPTTRSMRKPVVRDATGHAE
jgi:RimJ/RimL family protein N-acetyltransferase